MSDETEISLIGVTREVREYIDSLAFKLQKDRLFIIAVVSHCFVLKS
jgi:hypothetical protein